MCYNGLPLKQSIQILHFFNILTMVNHVVKDDQKPVSCSTMVSRILIDMLEPYADIAALKECPTMVYHCILFLRMSDLPWENLLLP